MNRLRSSIIVWSALALSACAPTRPPVQPTPPAAVTCEIPTAAQQCDDIWTQELGRHIDDVGLRGCLAQFRACDDGGAIRAIVRASDEYKRRQAAIEEANRWPGMWAFDNRQVTLGGKPADYNAISRFTLDHEVANGRDADVIAKFNEAKSLGTGYRVFRVFTTAVLMFDLSPERGRAALPHLLELARANGVYLEVVANADTALRDYDVEQHGLETAKMCAASEACALWSWGNELDHGTQKAALHDFEYDQRTAARIAAEAGLGSRWTAGAPLDDESKLPVGAVAVRHLTRDSTKMVRHLRDLAGLSDDLGVLVLQDEPMGCDEPGGSHGQRYYDDGTAFALGLVSAGFGLPWTYHMQAGTTDQPMGPQQRSCGKAMLDGARLIPVGIRPHFENTASTYIGGSHGWQFSPVQRADLADRNPATGEDESGCGQRVFSFLWGNDGLAVGVGLTCDPRIKWGNGWTPVYEIPTPNPSLRVWKIRRADPPTIPKAA